MLLARMHNYGLSIACSFTALACTPATAKNSFNCRIWVCNTQTGAKRCKQPKFKRATPLTATPIYMPILVCHRLPPKLILMSFYFKYVIYGDCMVG